LFFRDVVAVEDFGGEGSFHCNRHESLYDNLRSGARCLWIVRAHRGLHFRLSARSDYRRECLSSDVHFLL
jgi:hypothetical protein